MRLPFDDDASAVLRIIENHCEDKGILGYRFWRMGLASEILSIIHDYWMENDENLVQHLAEEGTD